MFPWSSWCRRGGTEEAEERRRGARGDAREADGVDTSVKSDRRARHVSSPPACSRGGNLARRGVRSARTFVRATGRTMSHMSTSAMSARARPFLNGASRGARRARVARPLAPAAAALKIGRVGGAVTPRAAIADPPGPVRGDAEKRAEEALLAGDDGDGTIAGFTKLEWSCIQTPARYLGNEIGAMHKDWDSAEVRFTMAYPEIYEVGASNLGHVVLYTILNQTEGFSATEATSPARTWRA